MKTPTADSPCAESPAHFDGGALVPIDWYRESIATAAGYACDLDQCDIHRKIAEDQAAERLEDSEAWGWCKTWGVGVAGLGACALFMAGLLVGFEAKD